MMRDDIFPGGVENAPAVGVSDVKPAYTIDPDRAAEDALRWSMATLLFQVLSIILFATAWIPGIEWFYSACPPPPSPPHPSKDGTPYTAGLVLEFFLASPSWPHPHAPTHPTRHPS